MRPFYQSRQMLGAFLSYAGSPEKLTLPSQFLSLFHLNFSMLGLLSYTFLGEENLDNFLSL